MVKGLFVAIGLASMKGGAEARNDLALEGEKLARVVDRSRIVMDRFAAILQRLSWRESQQARFAFRDAEQIIYALEGRFSEILKALENGSTRVVRGALAECCHPIFIPRLTTVPGESGPRDPDSCFNLLEELFSLLQGELSVYLPRLASLRQGNASWAGSQHNSDCEPAFHRRSSAGSIH